MIENYLYDVAREIKANALDVREQLNGASEQDKMFLEGKLLAYKEVLSLMLTQAKAFGLQDSSLGLQDFDPDAAL